MTRRRARDAGVSLIEVLVVLAIVGVTAGAAVLGLGALDREASAEAEAMRLADRLRLAADEAMLTALPLAMVWDERGYRFVAWDPARKGWRRSGVRDLGARHDLAVRLRLEPEGDPVPVVIAPDLPQPLAVLRVAGGDATWRVAFDGIGAAVAPLGD